ncbi:MAG: hydantoinase/oxoprolinase family protein [Gammaproteobacteria bacterium]|nr:hydantoinase/oxoprolinase family protein [Gammaproteobacteria bacterium]
MIRLGVDVGGTFTDLVFINDASGVLHLNKVPTTPDDPSIGTINGALELCRQASVAPRDVGQFFHGTTIATNIVLEHNGARTGMLTTAGYRDIIHIARHKRPYNFSIQQDLPWQKHPLVRRRYRLPITERILAPAGEIQKPLDEAQVRAAVRKLKDAEVEAVAVCFMFSFLNPEHEQRVGEIIAAEWPEVYLSLSHEVIPQYREYERFSTTCLNAFVGPKTARYVDNLNHGLKNKQFSADLHLMQTNGGVATAEGAVQRPVTLLMSGPVAGLIGGIWASRRSGLNNVITLDVGGTSADIGVAPNGEMTMKHLLDSKVGAYQAMLPMVDIDTIGAGGGSIAYVDRGGVFRVGPRSAGAVPGPCCYDRGGDLPTSTDCNAVLGRLNPGNFLGGRMSLRIDYAEQAIAKHLAGRLDMSVPEAALGALKILNHSMIQSIELNSVRKGYDPREFVLVAFGGGGPMQACEVAEELSIPIVVVPPNPGLTSALGLLATDLSYDYSRTQLSLLSKPDLAKLAREFAELEQLASAQLDRNHIDARQRTLRRVAECRYLGQGYELRVEAPEGELNDAWLARLIEAFHAVHDREYGRHYSDKDVELVNIRVLGIGAIPDLQLRGPAKSGPQPDAAARSDEREVIFDDGNGKSLKLRTGIYERDLLKAGNRITGPAIIEQPDTTTLILPERVAEIDDAGNILIDMS